MAARVHKSLLRLSVLGFPNQFIETERDMPHNSILGFPNQVIENEMDMSHGSLTNGSQITL